MITFPPLCNNPDVETLIRCPLGLLQLKTCTLGIHSLQFVVDEDQKIDLNAVTDSNVNVESKTENLTDAASATISWLQAYFRNPKQLVDITTPRFCFFDPQKVFETDEARFADRVLAELTKVEFGQTVTYEELAVRAENEKARASRAVGQVARWNPVCLIIPCHRVVSKKGGTGHYAGGTGQAGDEYKDAIKARLLQYESEKARA